MIGAINLFRVLIMAMSNRFFICEFEQLPEKISKKQLADSSNLLLMLPVLMKELNFYYFFSFWLKLPASTFMDLTTKNIKYFAGIKG